MNKIDMKMIEEVQRTKNPERRLRMALEYINQVVANVPASAQDRVVGRIEVIRKLSQVAQCPSV